jgi:hypothetical protein
MINAQFKDSDKSDKKKSGVGKKIGGVALLGGSAAGLFGAKGISLISLVINEAKLNHMSVKVS